MNRGRLVALEGLDGCGKSTQAARLVAALRDAGHEVVETREPTDGVAGRRIRAIARSGTPVAPVEELRWFTEDRREHVEGVIEPALAAGRWVVTDRYFLSTVAYQGARALEEHGDPSPAWRDILAAQEAEFPAPDAALLFELAADEGLARTRARGAPAEPVFERADFLARAAAIFAALERPYLVRVDAAGSVETVAERIWAALAERVPL